MGEIITDAENGEELTPNIPLKDLFEIAGFWRRFFAIAIDGFILGIPFIIIGFVFRDFAFSMGPWGRPIGYSAFFIYLTLMATAPSKGQTLGKKMMKIAIVDENGNYLPANRAALRTFIFLIISMLNGWAIPIFENPIIGLLASIIVFGGGLAMIYGLTFNRTTRQGIHDLIVGSYVIRTSRIPRTSPPALPPIHKTITFGLVGFALIMGLIGYFFQQNNSVPFGIAEQEEWADVQNLYRTLSEDEEFFAINIKLQNLSRLSGNSTETRRALIISGWVKQSCLQDIDHCKMLSAQIAEFVFEEYNYPDKLDGIQITIYNRFDLGLAHGTFSFTQTYPIEN